MVSKGRRDATNNFCAIREAALGAAPVVCRAGGACAHARPGLRRARGRVPPGPVGVDNLARAAAQRGHAQRQAGVSGQHGAVARRAVGASAEAGETGYERSVAGVCAGTAGRVHVRVHVRPGRVRGGRAGRRLEGSAAWTAAEPALGQGVEPAADRPAPAARFFRRRNHAHQPRGDLSGALRPGPGCAEARADGLPAHGTRAAGAAGAHARAGQVVCHSRGAHQRAPGGSRRPRCAGPLGGRPDPGPEPLGHRHACGAHDAVHDAAPPAADGGPR